MICRFFGGVFASAPLAIIGGTLADFWGPVDRGIAVCVFAMVRFSVSFFLPLLFFGPLSTPTYILEAFPEISVNITLKSTFLGPCCGPIVGYVISSSQEMFKPNMIQGFYYTIPPWLALDCMDHIDHGFLLWPSWCFNRPRNITLQDPPK